MKQQRSNLRLARVPLAAAIHLACITSLYAAEGDADQQDQPAATAQSAAEKREVQELGGITVTAQKREENLQDVPISMDVLDTYKLQEMNVANLNDYVKLLPSEIGRAHV